MFRRTGDQLPRGNFTLFAKCVYYDERETLYQRAVGIARTGTNRELLALLDFLGNRIEGTPTKRVEKAARHESRFFLMTKDGVQPLVPPRQAVGSVATPTEESAEDRLVRVTGP